MIDIQPFLNASAARHNHLCPRQVLGVRIGLLASGIFGTPPGENPGKRLLAIVESDGCFSDGVEVATGCSLGHRRLRLEDYGKIAATFVDLRTGEAARICPHQDARARAAAFLPQEVRHYFAQLLAYQQMPDDDLLVVKKVELQFDPDRIISLPGLRVTCDLCGEEIINQREVTQRGQTLCRSCSGEAYYKTHPLVNVARHE